MAVSHQSGVCFFVRRNVLGMFAQTSGVREACVESGNMQNSNANNFLSVECSVVFLIIFLIEVKISFFNKYILDTN